jgi:putative toxin-antitoxin system antitoxin component (TIGR02293 family)
VDVLDLASVMQAGRWKRTAVPMRYGEDILAARGGVARAAEIQGRNQKEMVTEKEGRLVSKTVRIARVTARAEQAFAGQPGYASAWLREPKSSLGDRTPVQLLATEAGALAVKELLIGIEHGMFA